jgi:ABC-type branched-subunit amino acid transport system substrate-binding protein
MRRKRWIAAAAVVAIASLVGAAGATATVKGGSARGVTAKTVTVASLGYSQYFADMSQGVKARLDLANKNKELPGGRKFAYLGLKDDKATAEGTVSAIRELVERDQVFAVVGSVAPYLTADYPNQQKVPIVGWGTNDPYCPHGTKSPWYFYGFTGCLNPTPASPYANASWSFEVLKQLEGQGKPTKGVTAALMGEDNDEGKQGIKSVGAGVTAAGMKITLSKATIPPAPAVVSDWTPYVQDILTSNNGGPPDVVYTVTPVANAIGLDTALQQAGYKGLITAPSVYASALTGTVNGVSAYTQFATAESASQGNAEMAKIIDAFSTVGISEDQLSQTALAGWFSADMFVGIAKKAGKNLTPESWVKAASKYSYSVDKTIGPTTYPQAYATATPCAQLATSNGTAWVVTAAYGCSDVYDTPNSKLIKYSSVNGYVKY